MTDLDKARPEVIVEVAIMQVSRDKTRRLWGISPPTSATVALQRQRHQQQHHYQQNNNTGNSVSSYVRNSEHGST